MPSPVPVNEISRLREMISSATVASTNGAMLRYSAIEVIGVARALTSPTPSAAKNVMTSDRSWAIRAAASDEMIIVTRLDGTVTTQSIPRKVSAPTAAHGFTPGEVSFPANPLVELAAWLAKTAARYTYWLLFLLLAALITLELARRRARRNRQRRRALE